MAFLKKIRVRGTWLRFAIFALVVFTLPQLIVNLKASLLSNAVVQNSNSEKFDYVPQTEDYHLSEFKDDDSEDVDQEKQAELNHDTFIGHDELFLDKSCNFTEDSSVMSVQKDRQIILKNTCERFPELGAKGLRLQALRHILVDKRHRTIYCAIPKVGCSHWKRAILSMANATYASLVTDLHQDSALNKVGLKYLDKYEEAERETILKSYFKFMIVRNPMERVISAYRDKFVLNNTFTRYFHRKFGRTIIRKYRENPSEESLRSGSDVQFPEFIKYLLELNDSDGYFNEHWEKYHDLCQPCIIKYDFIGKIETIGPDSTYVLGKMASQDVDGAHCPIKLNGAYSNHDHSSHVIDEFLGKISTNDRKKLMEIYKRDLESFAYTN